MPSTGSGAASGVASSPSSALPTETDLINFLIAAGLISSPPTETEELLDFEGAINGSIQEFKNATGRKTLLQDSADVAHTFSPPGHNGQARRGGGILGGGRLLQLDDGLLTFTSLTVEGTTYTRDEQFTLMPLEAEHQGGAFEWVEFHTPVFCRRGQIIVTGKWGIAATLPADLKRALLNGAAVEAMEQIALSKSGGLSSWMEGNVQESYTNDPMGKSIERMFRRFESVVNRYRLVRL